MSPRLCWWRPHFGLPLGWLLGNRIHLQLEEATFQRLVALALLLMGLLLLLRGV